MPSYKSHSIHGEILHPYLNCEVPISVEDIKTFSMGPDTLIGTDFKTFKYQHVNQVDEYFKYLIKEIKYRKLYNNPEVMAFLYGQLDHYILDAITHPLICYMTEGVKSEYKISQHGLIEMWIDDYMCQVYNKNKAHYYKKFSYDTLELPMLISNLYYELFDQTRMSERYLKGFRLLNFFDFYIRRNKPLSKIMETFKIGDITYKDELFRVLPYLNLNHDIWTHPETGMEFSESFINLWDKSIDETLITIDDINNYIYGDKTLRNKYIDYNISYNTGLPCELEQKNLYLKKN